MRRGSPEDATQGAIENQFFARAPLTFSPAAKSGLLYALPLRCARAYGVRNFFFFAFYAALKGRSSTVLRWRGANHFTVRK
ncbi:MAG TPA: hypothetical protein VJW20_05280 [Candidatus Angelobacter sp.]|nr:hypothetical protein [Candidatus Angelobacter sp.]